MKKNRYEAKKIRHYRIRKKISGTSDRPRLNVYRSNKYLYVQIIDDEKQETLLGVSSSILEGHTNLNKAVAYELGKLVAKKALAKKIIKVVFDRGGYLYHGKIAEFAKAARENGLQF